MSDLFWAGDERAGDLFSPGHFVAALTAVETAWLAALAAGEVAPAAAAVDLGDLGDLGDLTGPGRPEDVDAVAEAAEAGGNPVIPLVKLLRERLRETEPVAAQWLHRGLTSQDVVDTALVRCAGDVLSQVQLEFSGQIRALSELAGEHRGTLMAGRTLTQFAVPITFGLKAAMWLQSVLDAAEAVADVRQGLRAQFGGAAGTMAATAELAARAGLTDPAHRAVQVADEAAARLGLASALPWATSRAPITRIGDALVSCTDAWGRLATDVITLSRPEIAELSEPASEGRGASSTMPQKRNPILSVLIRRAALAAPLLGAQLHLAAADTGDERPAGAWHTEWATLQTLARRTAIAASQASELLDGLEVDPARMLATVEAAPGIVAERSAPGPARLAPRADKTSDDDGPPDPHDPHDLRGYLGTADLTIDAILDRASKYSAQEGQ